MKKIFISIFAILILGGVITYFAPPKFLYNVIFTVLRKKAGLTKKSIKIENHTIYYLEGGKGDSVFLLHGFGGNKDNWVQFAGFLTPRYHVVIIDIPGFGESSRIKSENYSVKKQVKRLDEIVNALGLNNFHIVGNSMGGAIAGVYTAEFSNKILSLALMDTAGIKECPNKSECDIMFENNINPFIIKDIKDYNKMLELVFENIPFMPAPVKAYLAQQSIDNWWFDLKIFTELNNEFNNEKNLFKTYLSKINLKTLLLWGKQDRIFDITCVGVLESVLTNFTRRDIGNCGHSPMIELPEKTAGQYLKFLKNFKLE